MKKRVVILFFAGAIIATAISLNKPPEKSALETYRPFLLKEMENMITHLKEVSTNHGKQKVQQGHYQKARNHYKHVELLIEYANPFEAKYFINGALVPKHEMEYQNSVIYPNGFQAIEELLYGSENPDKFELDSLNNDLITLLERLKTSYQSLLIDDEILLEQVQCQLFRLVALNLNGYDATVSLTGLQEAVWSLEGVEQLVLAFKPKYVKTRQSSEILELLLKEIKASKELLSKANDFYAFDRLDFIRNHILPLNSGLVDFHESVGLPWSELRKALHLNSKFLFGEEAFDQRFFSVVYTDSVQLSLRREIGEKLFFDPILSGNGKQTCANCHKPELAFTDGFSRSIHINGTDELSRNAPSLLNVGLQQAFFHDGRESQLEGQAFAVIHNKDEMGGNIDEIVKKLQQNDWYTNMFAKAFNGTDASITGYAVLNAISEYERSLVSLNSRFDKYLRGDDNQLNTREINGFNLFSGKALCGSCHFFPLFNGTVPPYFMEAEFEVLGTPRSSFNTQLDDDPGRFKISGVKEHEFAFKTPTVRNSEVTGPYMHNGIYNTLDEVVEFYHKGGGIGLDFELKNQTLPFDSLELTPTEKEDIVLFMKSLTDTTSYKRH